MTTYVWASPVGGDFDSPNNWETSNGEGPPAGPPGADDEASIRSGIAVTISRSIIFGNSEIGSLQASNGASISTQADVTTANQAGSRGGIVLLTNSSFTIGGLLTIANNGIDINSNVTQGSTLSALGGLALANGAQSDGQLFVQDTGSSLNTGDGIVTIGNGGHGVISVLNGGAFHGANSSVVIGNGSFGQLLAGAFVVGNPPPSTLEIGTLAMGLNGGTSELRVANDSTAHVFGEMGLGNGGSGSIQVNGGGSLTADADIFAAMAAGSTFSINVGFASPRTGAVSRFRWLQDLEIGYRGSGNLNVTSGALASGYDFAGNAGTGDLHIGRFGTGQATVDGAGSRLEARNLTVGGRAPNPATVENGECGDWTYAGGFGRLTISNDADVVVRNTLTLLNEVQAGGIQIKSGGSLEVGGNSGAQANQLLIDAGGLVVGHGWITFTPASAGATRAVIINPKPATVVVNGTLEAKEGLLVVEGNVSGSGEAVIDDNATLEFKGAVAQGFHVRFNGGYETTLKLYEPGAFEGTIAGLTSGDTIYLPGQRLQLAQQSSVVAHTQISGSQLLLTLENGNTLAYQLEGAFTNKTFTIRELRDTGVSDSGITLAEANPMIRTGVAGSGYGNPYLDSLIWGWAAWNAQPGPLTYWFGTTADVDTAIHGLSTPAGHGETAFLRCDEEVDAWTAQEKTAFQRAVQIYSEVSGLRFQQASSASAANLVWWLDRNFASTDPGAGATSETPARRPDGHLWLVFDHSEWSDTPNVIQPGGASFGAHALHEIGHALGLAHPHDGGFEPDGTVFSGVTGPFSTGTNAQNQQAFSVMSYNLGLDGGASLEWGGSTGLGAFDIAAIQRLYGINTTFRTGGDTYILPKVNAPGTGWSCIWDAGGADTLSNAGSALASTLDLRSAPLVGPNAGGFVSRAAGIQGGFAIANGAIIENAVGGDGVDTITGNAAANRLMGGRGDDMIDGGAGIDTAVFGGNESDYALTSVTVSGRHGVRIVDGRTGSPDGADTLFDIEFLRFADVLDDLNRPPIAAPDTAVVFEYATVAGNVITGGAGGVGRDIEPDNTALSVTALSGANGPGTPGTALLGFYGALTVQANGSYSYVANRAEPLAVGATVDDVFTYTVSDPQGSSDVERLTITVRGASTGTSGDNHLIGSDGNDTLRGLGGNDTIDGRAGADTMIGGAGNDRYLVENVGDTITEIAGEGADRVEASVSSNLGANVENLTLLGAAAINGAGNALPNTITGNSGANALDGKAGNDLMVGLGGNDIYMVDAAGDRAVEAAGKGSDRVLTAVSFTLEAGSEIEVLKTTNDAGTGAINLTGNAFANQLLGNAGANTLDGKAGADILQGLGGNDIYMVDAAADRAVEAAGKGSDRVLTSVSFTLEANSEIELLKTTNDAGTGAIKLTGNNLGNHLLGNAGANTLDGKAGVDILQGFGGNDWYYVDSAGDRAVEAAGKGSDRVLTSVSFTLEANSEIELLRTTNDAGTGAIKLTGNNLANHLYGNAGANTLDGKAGIDIMQGLGGNDFYYVDSAGDRAVEAAGKGADRVFASASFTLEAGSEVETLTTTLSTATTAIKLTGNAFANMIVGNAGANTLDGKAGVDLLQGLGGNDFFYVDHASDRAIEAAGGGADRAFASASYSLEAGSEIETLTTTLAGATTAINLTGNAFVNAIVGNAGGNVINGLGGNDTLLGLGGSDFFLFNTALNASTNVDRLADFNVAADTVRLENAIFTTLGGGTLVAGAFRTGSAALDADDRIIYNSAAGTLTYDSNGNAGGGATLFATLATGLALTNADFLVV